MFFIICPLLISLYNIAVLIITCRFESTLLLKYVSSMSPTQSLRSLVHRKLSLGHVSAAIRVMASDDAILDVTPEAVVVVDPTPPTCCQQSPAPESCGSQQSLPPGGKERLHFVGIRPEVQARKGGW